MQIFNLISGNSLYVARGVSLLCHGLRIFLLAAILSADGYAEWGALIYAAQLLTLITSFGLREGMYVVSLRSARDLNSIYQAGFVVFSKLLPFGLVLSGIFFFFGLNLAWQISALACIYIILLVVNDLLIQYFRLRERFLIIAIAEILLNATPVILLYLFVPSNFANIIITLILGALLSILVYYIFRPSDLSNTEKFTELNRIFRIGIPLTSVTFCATMLNNGFLTVFLPGEMEQSLKGNIVLSNNIATALLVIPNIFVWKHVSDLIRSSGAKVRDTEAEILKYLSSIFLIILVFVGSVKVALGSNLFDLSDEWTWRRSLDFLPYIILFKYTILVVGLEQARITALGYNKTLLAIFGVFAAGIYPLSYFFQEPQVLAFVICLYGTIFQVTMKAVTAHIAPIIERKSFKFDFVEVVMPFLIYGLLYAA